MESKDLEVGGVLPRIQNAAITLFGKKGVSATTTRNIATLAGVAEGALYRHYESKSHLARSLHREKLLELGKQSESVLHQHQKVVARLRRLVAELYRSCADAPDVFRFALLATDEELVLSKLDGITPFDVIHRILVDGVQSGEIECRDPRLQAWMLLGSILAVASSSLDERLEGLITERAPAVAESCLRTIGIGVGA